MKIPAELPIKHHKTFDIQDSSKVQEFMDCPRKYFYRYVLGWEIDEPNIHLVFGEGWHRAMEHLLRHGYDRKNIVEAYQKFLEYYRRSFPEVMDTSNHPKSPANALQALVDYTEKYKHDNFDVIYTEIAGSVQVDERRSLHFKIDGVIKGEEGYYAMEHKTGSALTGIWTDQWILKMQIGTYTHVLNCIYSQDDVYGVKINGAIFRKSSNAFIRAPIRKSKDMMQVWLWNMVHFLDMIEWNFEELSRCSDEDEVMMAFPMNSESCTKYYRMCKYFDFCMSWGNPLRRCSEPPPDFGLDWWNPTDREKEPGVKVMNVGTEGEKEEE